MRQAAARVFEADCEAYASLPSEPVSLELDASYTIGHVEAMVAEGLRNLRNACARMRRVESELQFFLREYAEQAGALCAQLASLREQIRDYDGKLGAYASQRLKADDNEEASLLAALQEELPALPRRLEEAPWDGEAQAVYLRLVSLCRPEPAAQARYSDKVNRLLAQAYDKGGLWGMRALEHTLVEHAEARRDTPQRKLARLRERLDVIAESVQRVRCHTEALEAMPAMQLKRQAQTDTLWLEKIIHRMRKQIAAAQKLLARRKIEYRALSAASCAV